MNIAVNEFYKNKINKLYNNASNKQQNLRENQILTALVTEKTQDKISLVTKDGFRFDGDAARVTGEVGDELTFMVRKNDQNGIVLSQIKSKESLAKSQKKLSADDDTMELFKKSNFVREEKKPGEALTEEDIAISKLKNSIHTLENGTTNAVISKLVSSGVSLDKISVNMLSSLILEVDKEKGVSLPLTPENEQRVKQALDKLKEALPLSDSSIASLLKNDKALSIENIYKSKFSQSDMNPAAYKSDAVDLDLEAKQNEPISDEDFQKLQNSLNELFEREGIELNEENKSAARFLIDFGVNVTRGNVYKSRLLKSGVENESVERQLRMLARAGIDLERAGLDLVQEPEPSDELQNNYKNIIIDLQKIETQKIELLYRSNIPITLRNLRLGQALPEAELKPLDLRMAENINEAKLNLEEIRLKLTTEAANRLIGKNINIDTLSLRDAVMQIRQVNREQYEGYLKAADAPVTDSNVGKMTEFYAMLAKIKPPTNNVFGKFVSSDADFTVKGIYEEVQKAKAGGAYDVFRTVPIARFGDSFDKVYGQFSDLLEKLSLKATEENMRAASILSKNNLEINEEMLDKVKVIDAKINSVVQKLHPFIAAKMVKDGITPSEMHVDELIEYIGTFGEQYGEDSSDKVARVIAEMEQRNELDQDSKDSLVAIYRMLSQIRKDGGAAIGLVLKSDMPVTLNNLFEASKHLQKTKGSNSRFDLRIDEQFGYLEDIKKSDIRENIERISNKTALINNEIDKVIDISERLRFDIREYVDMPLSEAVEQLEKRMAEGNFDHKGQERTVAEFTQRLKQISNYPPEVIQRLNPKGTFTLGNLLGIKKWAEDSPSLDVENVLSELSDGKEPEAIYQEMLGELSERMSEVDFRVSDNVVTNLDYVKGLFKSVNESRNKDDFTLPIRLKSGLTTLKMFVLNKKSDPSVFLTLDTKKSGNVSIFFQVDGKDLKLQMDVQKKQGYITNNIESLKEELRQLGYSPLVTISGIDSQLEEENKDVTVADDEIRDFNKLVSTLVKYIDGGEQ